MRRCRTTQPDTLLNKLAPARAAILGLSLLGVSAWLTFGLMPVSVAADMPGQSVEILLGPLKAGTYGFYGEFHPDTAKGKIVAK